MIKIRIKRENKKVYEIVIKGHANYDTYGNDIVCAAVSTMAITTVNGILALEDSLDYEENSGLLIIRTKENTDVNQKLLDNLITMLEELKSQYPKNIEIRNED